MLLGHDRCLIRYPKRYHEVGRRKILIVLNKDSGPKKILHRDFLKPTRVQKDVNRDSTDV